MPEKFAVTIARQFGSLGRPIARSVSEALGIEYYDRDIVEYASRKLNLPVSTISDAEERARSAFFNMNYPLGMGTTAIQDAIFDAQRRIIVDLAEKDSCIIVGRCADTSSETIRTSSTSSSTRPTRPGSATALKRCRCAPTRQGT